MAQLATSDTPRAHEAVAAFRRYPEPSILVTVAMAYEGLDVPEVAVVAALTHIRSRPWLEQMVARATRVDPHAGPYETQRALVFHPDDPLFQRFRIRMETEQGTLARVPRRRGRQAHLPFWVAEELAQEKDGIVPLESNALALRFTTLRPGPDLAMQRPEQQEAQAELLETPSVIERRLRARVGELVAAQAVEDETGPLRAAPRRGRTRSLSSLQRRAEACDGRQEPGADDALRTRSRDRLAGAEPPMRAPGPAGRRSALCLVGPQAAGMEAAGRPDDGILGPTGEAGLRTDPGRVWVRRLRCRQLS